MAPAAWSRRTALQYVVVMSIHHGGMRRTDGASAVFRGGLLLGGVLLSLVTPLSAQTPDTAPLQAADSVPGDVATEAPAELSAEQERSDEAIAAELRAIFDRVPAMTRIQVSVSAGVVRLTGEVADREAAERAAELARSRDGVVYVDETALTSLNTEARLEDVGGRLGDQLSQFLQLLPLLGVALGIVVVSGILAWLVGRGGTRTLFPKLNPFLSSMLRRFVQFGIVVVGLIVALELLDATALVGAVVGTAGLAGLAIGFAFKDIVENYLAGVILSFRQPFARNDLVVIGGHEGKVIRLTGRETILMTLDGNHVQIPNATVFREPMINYTRNPRRRARIDVEVTTDVDPSTAIDVGLRVLREMKGVIDDPPPASLITGFGQGTMMVSLFGWVDQRSADFGRVQSEAFRLVKSALEEAGIETPSPEYRVSFSGEDEEAEGGLERRTAPADERVAERPLPEPQRDVSVDRAVDEQIEEERRKADEEDLLK